MLFRSFCGVDEAGHKHGSIDAPYFEGVARIDNYVKELQSILQESGDAWNLIVITDHGHRDEGGHGGDSAQERASFVIAHGINKAHPIWPIDLQPHQLTGEILKLI